MKKTVNYFLFLLIILVISSCKKDETPNHGLTANAGPDQNVTLGETVTLNATTSIDFNGGGFTTQWDFTSIPDGSSVSISNATSAIATFVPDIAGNYTVQLTIANQIGQSTDAAIITAVAPQTMELGGTYSEELHLKKLSDDPSVPDYTVTNNLVMSARLIIDPGVQIKVSSDFMIRITQNGSILANGTETAPIVISGTSDLAGFWRGIWIQSTNIENSLNHLHLSGAGSNTMTTGASRSGLLLTSARVGINNCRFSNIDGYGIATTNVDTQIPLENTQFNNNALGAMHITAAQIRNIDSQSNFNNQEIVVTSTTISINADHIWPPAQNGSYRFSGSLNIYDNVTIEAGAIIVFDNDAFIRFRSESVLKALGTETNPIVFKGKVEQPAAWKGILMESSNLENRLEHVHFAHAGQSNLASGFGKAALGFANNARATLSNIHFEEIDGYGIYIRYDDTRINFENMSFGSGLALGAIHMHVIHIPGVDNGSNFRDNYIIVNGGQVPEIDNVQWNRLLNGKYLFISSPNIYGKVTIEPGTILEFDHDILMRVRTNGILSAQGTASEKILFTRKEGSSSNWRGLTIETNSIENVLDHVEISFAGNANLISGMGAANVGVGTGSRLTLTNSIISNSLGYGVFLRTGAEFTESDNTYNNNVLGENNLKSIQ
jgi:hypothetical protein